MAGRLDGRVALVLGAGSSGPGWGNGKAAAVLYAREGARVAAVDVNPAAAEETRALIAGEGGEAIALAADVTDEDAVATAVGRTVTLKKSDTSANAVTVTERGGAGPDNEPIPLTGQGHALTVMSDGNSWHILARYS